MKQCTREDLRVEAIATAHVDDNGQVIADDLLLLTAGVIDYPNISAYYCAGPCTNDVDTLSLFDTWEEALKHVEVAV